MDSSLVQESRLLRWLAWTCHPDAARLALEERRDWPESTTLFHQWAAAEDYILEHITVAVLSRPTAHLSLHFDGVAVDPKRVGDEGKFLDYIQRYVLEKTGFKINLRVKQSLSWCLIQ